MRIGIDCRLWSESGVGRYTRNLVQNLAQIDIKNEYVLFILSKDQEKILHFVQNDSFRTVKADIRWHSIEEQIRFPSILNQEKLDLVHFPYFSVPIFYNKPFVVTIHDLILHHFPTGEASTLPLSIYKLKLLGYKYVISQAAKKAKKIITVSNATKEEIIDHLGVREDKIVVTYESVDDRLISKLPTSPFDFAQGFGGASKIKNYFLYVGNAYPHKNLERLLQAFKIITQGALVGNENFLVHDAKKLKGSSHTSKPASAHRENFVPSPRPLTLVLVGKEDYFYKRLREIIKNMKLSDSVIFYGEASDEELINLYQNAKALVMPSLMEGFGLPALEAMANSCLVLASNIPALKEVCGDAAIYFSAYDINEITEVMKSVCFNDSNHFSQNIGRGIERSKMFSWKKMAKETVDIYESCVGI
ncbi:MAG: glycosyltransferase family 1 protein [bacterium]|nr:glycosyltransferase family 1 protein [bacterium]